MSLSSNGPVGPVEGYARGRQLDVPDDSLSPAMEEVVVALAPIVPAPALRLAMVNQLFRLDRSAPYVLAIQALTGSAVSESLAVEAWERTLEVQQRWSERLNEVVSVKSAAIEALDRCRARHQTVGGEETPTRSIRDYLERDLRTGLYQRAYYDARLGEEVQKASPQRPLSLIFLQLWTDTTGARDQYAEEDMDRRVGELLRHHFRATDLPCVYGSEYFAILMPDTPAVHAYTRGQELIPALQQVLRGAPIVAAVGVAASPEAGITAPALESAATSALTSAREAGDWTIQLYVPRQRVESPSRWPQRIALIATCAAVIAIGLASCSYLRPHNANNPSAQTSPTSGPVNTPTAAAPAAHPSGTGAASAPQAKPVPSPQPAFVQETHPARPGHYAAGAINRGILAYYRRHGRAELGAPRNMGPGSVVHSWPTASFTAEVQDFYGGSHGKLILFNTPRGTHEVNEIHGLDSYYVLHGGMAHFGAPINNEYPYGKGTRQDFEGASLTWDRKHGVQEHARTRPS